MKWFKNLFRRYSLVGDKLKNPCNLDEAMVALGHILDSEEKEGFKKWGEDKFVASLHHSLGRWIRNNWGLWNEKSKLHNWFKVIGIWHADDMSGIILTSYYRKEHGLSIKLDKQIQCYIEYWANVAENFLTVMPERLGKKEE